ncbi:unnamed protein product [Rotaria sp. Silwood1]|nr:unnamed protein product [Rotaria sp. Silwood1]CAF1629021.1 unnamed protein product [Rotaria sp. Silwood1]CAF3750306.1 unnamed protein product [Rotaria sp. Silwood1]CAF3763039.1 unnamed protein product [Rotaria sp. Silwood1]CAF3796273.1 unnamed protein product [Rotaria sp. Silwood1]
MATGFDALKMINLNEAPSASDKLKFRLFNLDDGLGKTYLFDADGIQHSYTTSRYVQATKINMKTKVAIETISKTYQEFRRSYFRSYSFTVGIPIPLGVATFDISFGYHRTLSQVYETITKKEGSVGISSDWWGIYNVHLAPTYLLKFDSLFTAALDKLVSNPTTSKDQAYYNRLIETFGTHYVSAVIVGGLGNLYTYITSNYAKEYSRSAVEEGIRIGFSVAMNSGLVGAGGNSVYTWGEETSSLTEEFKQNSEMQTKFIPAVIISPQNERRQWDVWKNQTLLEPAVVNRTLSPLVDLLLDYPDEVQKHLQATIDYYLLNGVLPTLNQVLSSKSRRKKRALINLNQARPIPGLDVVGCGFDIGDIESRQCLFDLSTNTNTTSSWIDVYNNDKTYMIPPNFFVSDKRDASAMYESRFFKTLDEFFQMSIYSIQEDNNGFLGLGATSKRKDIIEKYRQFYDYKYQMAWTRRQISMYTLSLATFPTPQFNDITQQAIDQLPNTFDNSSISNIKKWKAFFNAYGTHFVASSDMGGLLWAEDYFEGCLITKYSERWVREQLRRSYWFFGDITYSESYTMNVDQIYKTYRLSMSKLIGGIDNNPGKASSIEPYVINAWISTLKNHPQPINYRLLPIYTLLPKGDKKAAMKTATYYFRLQAAADANLYIQRLQTHPNPPPLPKLDCSPTARQRKRAIKSSAFDLTRARKSLCPVVGFRGTFCPGDPTWSINFTNSSLTSKALSLLPRRNLPNGVGMAIDISNGNVLLPALQLTYPLSLSSGSVWKDPHSGRIFILPNEVSLEPLNDNSLDVNVSLYSTPAEFIDAWLRVGVDSDWSASLLSNLQDISNIDSTYFSDDQGTAIAQNYSKLYNLRVKGIDDSISLPLNSYARTAINALTATYDEDLYNAFFNAWGTHIVVETTVGGITEKQILFQKCLNSSVARLNVKAELLSKRSCINEDYHKWRKSFSDRRIGGNVDLIQDTNEWFRTLAYAPAMISAKRYVSWTDIVTNPSIKQNLQDAINRRINNANEDRQEQVNKVFEQRKLKNIPANLILWRVTQIDDLTNSSVISYPIASIPALLQNINICGSGQTQNELLGSSCTFTIKMTACGLQSNSLTDRITEVPISYERNLVTGDFRVTALRQYGIGGDKTPFKNYDLVGNWVRSGCSEIINNQCGLLALGSVHRVQLCTRCYVLCANAMNTDLASRCTCPSLADNNCPAYSEAGPYQPYCNNEG